MERRTFLPHSIGRAPRLSPVAEDARICGTGIVNEFDTGGPAHSVSGSLGRAVRAPGNTCLSFCRETKRIGQPASNNSKSCGGLMRIAPVALMAERDRVFELSNNRRNHAWPSVWLFERRSLGCHSCRNCVSCIVGLNPNGQRVLVQQSGQG
jgi:hypothetical protein